MALNAGTSSPTVVYLPVGRRTFDMEAAESVFGRTTDYLRSLPARVLVPENVVTTPEELEEVLDRFAVSPDLVVLQFTTFVDASFAKRAAEAYEAPFLIWAVPEPETGARLRLNSLTGANSTAHHLHDAGRRHGFVYGGPEEPEVQEQVERQVRVRRVAGELSRLAVGVVGEPPPGFFFAATDERELRRRLGVRVHRMDLREAFRAAGEVPAEEWQPVVEELSGRISDVDPRDERVGKSARFAAYLRRYCGRNGLGAVALKNWPEFFDDYRAAADAAMGLLCDTGIPCANESDVHGAITMYVQQQLAGSPAYLGDLAYADEEENSFTFWHDGAGAPSLARPGGARAGVHPNRGIGLTVEMCLKPGTVTITRIGYGRGRYRLLILRGEVLDEPQRFYGTSAVVRPEGNAPEILRSLLAEGWEPHYSLVYGDVVEDLEELGRQFGIGVYSYA